VLLLNIPAEFMVNSMLTKEKREEDECMEPNLTANFLVCLSRNPAAFKSSAAFRVRWGPGNQRHKERFSSGVKRTQIGYHQTLRTSAGVRRMMRRKSI
jgi:hypothetical protein